LFGVAWAIFRLPKALDQLGQMQGNQPTTRIVHLLGIGYLYALSVAANAFALPAVATNVLSADDAAAFYVAWMLASLLSVLASAVANAVVAGPISQEKIYERMCRVMSIYCLITLVGGAMLALAGPLVLHLYGARYQQ